jgi:hypothetical protein
MTRSQAPGSDGAHPMTRSQAPGSDGAHPTSALRLARGAATPEELAAVVAVLSAATAGVGDPPAGPRHTEWASPARRMAATVPPGPDAWRGSARPR